MNLIDDRLNDASQNLAEQVDQLNVPAFKPNRSVAPGMLAVALLLGFGMFGYFSFAGGQTADVAVATQPEAEAPAVGASDSNDGQPEPAESESAAQDAAAQDSTEPAPTGSVRAGAIFDAQPGEFYVPLPTVSAWNSDESKLLIYQTGAANRGHVVIDSASGQVVATLRIDPGDIEQVYWSDNDPSVLFYTDAADLVRIDLDTADPTGYTTTVMHSFAMCDNVDSGPGPVRPSKDLTFGLLCYVEGTAPTKVTYQSATDTEQRGTTESDSAPAPSPSGDFFVEWNSDGSAKVLGADLSPTGIVLDLDDNVFSFVVDATGREWVAATLFDGNIIGTLVLLPLDGGAGVVVIGPERGDPYPPPSNRLSVAGHQVLVSINGASGSDDPTALAGGIHLVDVSDPFNPTRTISLPHKSEGLHGYWSTPFVSLSPTGRYAVYSTDLGSDRVNSYIIDFNDPTG